MPNNLLVSGVAALVLNLLIRGGAGSFFMFMWEFAGRASTCGPRTGVPCPEGTGYGLAGPWVALAAVLALLAHLWREGVRGPMPAAAAPFVPGTVLGARFLWSAAFVADTAQSRVTMAVIGLLSALLLGVVYGRRLIRRWGTALLLWGVRLDRGGPVPASGPVQASARNVLLALSLTGTVLGCTAGVALV
ncbi:hypothetical protein ACIRFH_03160 [Streptomyces sp. NPDC093586]|uniref:hypothetical protein n=1 Tax=Streptomyces sp. NPDC093586 TaxID=3366042 RepID=UPI00381DC422